MAAAPSYDLPEGAIAQTPIEPRDAARLLVDLGPSSPPVHARVRDLPGLLREGDLVVVNESKVLRARLRLRKPTGGAVEVLLLEQQPDDDRGLAPDRMSVGGRTTWKALVKPSRKLAPGTVLDEGDLVVRIGEVLEGGARRVWVEADDVEAALARHGEVPLPPYITAPLADPDRYQTVYATELGSVAAPTAGLHVTEGVLDGLRARGISVARVDLHVGLDTFRPVTAERLEDHEVHAERYSVPDATVSALESGARVVAIGTTTVRALESWAATGEQTGRTRLLIHGDYDWRVVDVLLTNFHLPRSTLLLLVESFIGPRWRDLYACALTEGYRFLSFGDAMLLSRAQR